MFSYDSGNKSLCVLLLSLPFKLSLRVIILYFLYLMKIFCPSCEVTTRAGNKLACCVLWSQMLSGAQLQVRRNYVLSWSILICYQHFSSISISCFIIWIQNSLVAGVFCCCCCRVRVSLCSELCINRCLGFGVLEPWVWTSLLVFTTEGSIWFSCLGWPLFSHDMTRLCH